MEYIKENVKKQKMAGTVLGMTDNADCTIINKLVSRDNIALYSSEEYKALFKKREIANAIKSGENLIVTANNDVDVEELKQAFSDIEVTTFEFSGQSDIEFNCLKDVDARTVCKALLSEDENEYVLDTAEEALAHVSDEASTETILGTMLERKVDELPERMKSENGIALEKYFEEGKQKVLIVKKENEEAFKVLINLLKLRCEETDVPVTMIVDENEMSSSLIQPKDNIRVEMLCGKESELKVAGTIEIRVNTEYTVVLGDEWVIFKTPTAEELAC